MKHCLAGLATTFLLIAPALGAAPASGAKSYTFGFGPAKT